MAMRKGRGARSTPYERPEAEVQEEADPCTVFVGNLSFDTTWKDLKSHMGTAGQVLRADIMERNDGTSRGMGLVRYSAPEEVEEASRA